MAPQTMSQDVVSINNHFYGPSRNPKAGQSFCRSVVESNKSTSIAFRTLQLLDRVCKAVAMFFKEMGNTSYSFFENLSVKFSLVCGFLSIPRLPDVIDKAHKAITTWGGAAEGPEGYALRGHVQRVHDVADCAATVCYVGSMVGGSMPLKNTADVFDFGSNIGELVMAAEDHSVAGKHLEHIETNHASNKALQERFAETKKEALLRVIKAVASVVSGTLGLLVLFFGGPILPAAVLLAISLTSTIFALAAHFFKETAIHEKVRFFEWARKPDANGLLIN